MVTSSPFTAPNGYTSPTFEEPCTKCRGTGFWRPGYRCFTCKGSGKLTFKTSREKRAKARQTAAVKKVRTQAENVEFFKTAHPDLWAWMDGNHFPFAAAMVEAVTKYGSLTENQTAACLRMIEKRNASRAAAADRIANAPVADAIGIDRLKAAFDSAIAASKDKGLQLRSPRISIGSVRISPAKADSANAGALYVKDGSTYLGKIAGGKFLATRECTDQQRDQVLQFVADPEAAAKAYGQETGNCCLCGATLKSKWRNLGIGPICAKKFGW